MKILLITESARDNALAEARCLREVPDLSALRVRPSLPQAIRDHRYILYRGATHSTPDPDRVVRCVYNARRENYELRFILTNRDAERDGPSTRVDWQTTVDLTDATYATWAAAVKAKRTVPA